ncbi:FliH/SctL family protein [Buchnera aphidicola]|uniref:FliH/SctL family protein n=1 Tax=Buchnera aphidicola TaxID=9 RepID=UPI0034648CAF
MSNVDIKESNADIKKIWKLWYPKETFLKKSKNNKIFFSNLHGLTEKDFCIDLKDKKNFDQLEKKNEIKSCSFNKESYNLGFSDGIKKQEEKNIILDHKLNALFLKFDVAISLFDKMLYTRLLKTVLIISSYVIGKNIKFDKSILLKKIKNIMNNDNFFLKKTQLIIHPNNKKILKKIIENSVHSNKLELYYDDSIDINGCKIRSENGDVDNTIDARWKEICRLVSEES